MHASFKGTGVALITPFNANKEIDYEGLSRLLTHTSNLDYWVVQGTTGESVTTSDEEKAEILAFVKANNPKNLPVIYGIGGNNTAEVLRKIQKTDFSGVTAVLSVTPYYNKPSQQGLIAHYQAIADTSPVPVILYNVPGRTATNLHAETTLTLAQHPNIIGIKESSGDLVQCMEIVAHKPADFLMISGEDLLTLPMMSVGAIGLISVMANAFPQVFKNMTDFALKNDYVSASQELFKLLKINPLMYEEGNPVGVKEVLAHLQICQNHVRLPLIEASESLSVKIRQVLAYDFPN
jgi:4-hydroxy-tetrahydrodipicolinate synthase